MLILIHRIIPIIVGAGICYIVYDIVRYLANAF